MNSSALGAVVGPCLEGGNQECDTGGNKKLDADHELPDWGVGCDCEQHPDRDGGDCAPGDMLSDSATRRIGNRVVAVSPLDFESTTNTAMAITAPSTSQNLGCRTASMNDASRMKVMTQTIANAVAAMITPVATAVASRFIPARFRPQRSTANALRAPLRRCGGRGRRRRRRRGLGCRVS